MHRLSSPPPFAPDTMREVVDWAVVSRRSIRAFLPTPVSRDQIESILEVAKHAASSVNTQPWQVHVLTGESKSRLTSAVLGVYNDPDAVVTEPYPYYPVEWVEPFLARRRKVGWDLYQLLGIDRADKAAMHRQHERNFRFFDAPVGLIFTIDRTLAQGSFLDYGMFLQGIMIAARARGLDTCPQAAFTAFHEVISRELAIAPDQMLVCGMSLGYADPSRIENSLVSERTPVAGFAHFHEDIASRPLT